MSIYLYFGDEFLVLEELKKLKKNIKLFSEFWGFEDQEFDLGELLGGFSIFGEKKIIIIRAFIENNKISPLVDTLIDYIQSNNQIINYNEIYLFQYGKVSANLKLYKLIKQIGLVKEFKKPSTKIILNQIKKRLKIDDQAGLELINKTSANLFAIKNEINKLKHLSKITTNEIKIYVIDMIDNSNIWGISDIFLEYIISPTLTKFKDLITNINILLNREVDEMFILNIFYNSLFKLVLMADGYKNGQDVNELKNVVGYYFYNKYYNKVKDINLNILFDINKILLNYEYEFKSGLINSNLGLKQSLIKIFLYLSKL